jgi:hypothetical protein
VGYARNDGWAALRMISGLRPEWQVGYARNDRWAALGMISGLRSV